MEEHYKSTAGQGFGVAALVVGIIALILSFIPCIGVIALLPAVVGIVFGVIAFMQANRGNGAKGLIISALIVSSLALVASVAWSYYFTQAFDGKKFMHRRPFELFDSNSKKYDDINLDTANSKLDKLEEDMDKLHKDSIKK